VNLLIGFLYGGEYDPKLPVIAREDQAGIWTVTVPKDQAYNYDFPHTCRESCGASNLCPHHNCRDECYSQCVKFVCKECTTPQPPEADSTQMLLHAKMYEIGDKYDIAALKNLAREKFERACRKYWKDEQFSTAAAYALNTTPDNDESLRDILCKTITIHRELLDCSTIEALLNEHAQFAFAVVKRLAADLDRRECGHGIF
jgi:hypothetical protein